MNEWSSERKRSIRPDNRENRRTASHQQARSAKLVRIVSSAHWCPHVDLMACEMREVASVEEGHELL